MFDNSKLHREIIYTVKLIKIDGKTSTYNMVKAGLSFFDKSIVAFIGVANARGPSLSTNNMPLVFNVQSLKERKVHSLHFIRSFLCMQKQANKHWW